MSPIYLDYNATTPIAPEVASAMRPFLDEYFGNPSSTHSYGTKTKMAVEKARAQLASLLSCEPSEIIFTSGGTESNNYALKGAAFANKNKGKHIITSSIEHPAIFEVCIYLEKQGFEISYLPVDEYGMVSIDDLEKAFRPDTILVSIMHANNEVGTIQPIKELAELAHSRGILFHTDAAQSLGKIDCNVQDLGVDMLSVAGHKLYAPKGIGALFIRNGVKLEKLIHGADHEQNMRAGTENVLEIVGLGKACELAGAELDANKKHYQACRDHLHQLISKELPNAKLNGHPELRLPNTLSLSFPKIEANTLVARLENIAVSAGAACHSESIDVSAVLEAMKVPIETAMGTIRFSTGRQNSLEEMENAAKEVIQTVRSLMPKENQGNLAAPEDKKSFKLTQYTHGLGCACKIEPQKLEKILKDLPFLADKNILVGTETADDAAVYHLDDEHAIVQSLDFFTPIVDDPYEFGSIAASNALSDIYAMGAKPLFAMSIVGFPENTLPLSVLKEILKGAHDKAAEAGIAVVGGHSIEDPEPKYGMVVSGLVHPQKIIRNVGMKEGDQLILTKALGSGIASTAMKRGLLTEEARKTAIATMAQLNKTAAEIMVKYPVHACTDITGFGLLGHLREMSSSSAMDATIYFSKLRFLPEIASLATAGIIPGGTFNNLDHVSAHVDFGSLGRTQQLMMADAQTSGGLLMAMEVNVADKVLEELQQAGLSDSTIIGECTRKGDGKISVQS